MLRLQKILRPFLILMLLLIVMGVSAQTTQLPAGFIYALDGTTALVDNKVYVRSGNNWVEQATLLPDRPIVTGSFGERYGTATALQGDTAVITSYGHEYRSESEPGGEEIPGSVFIFKRTGTTWDFQQEIVFVPNFGRSVDIDGNTIIVSNEGNSDNGHRSTVNFVEYDGSTWSRTETFVTFYDTTFSRVAISGDVGLAYGQLSNNTPITRTYSRSSGVWSEQDSLPGGAFDISGNTAVINNDVYSVYNSNGLVWTLVTTLVPDEPFNPSGNDVAIQFNTVVIAGFDKSFVFTRSGTTWTQDRKLTVDGGDVGLSYENQSVEVSGAFVLVAPYVFDLNDIPEPQNLLFNGDFEINVDNDVTVPDGWTRKNTTADERRCNKPGKTPVAYSGNCTYFLKGGTTSNLAQNIDLNVHSLNAGDRITLTGFYNKQSAGDVNVWIYVSYINGVRPQAKITVRQQTSGYQALPPVALTLTGTPTRVRVVFDNRTTSGRMWVDAMRLQKTASGGGSTTSDSGNLLPLALPALPETESDNSRALPLPLP